MHRGYSARASRFDQPDPYDGSYDLTNPQSLNRYAYTQNDPVNFVDPSGSNMAGGGGGWSCSGTWSAERTPEGQIVNFRITSINCTGLGGGGRGSQNSGRAQLTDKQRAAYEKSKRLAENALHGKCIHFLMLKGFDATSVRNALDLQKPYDLFRSTIPAQDAGLSRPYDDEISMAPANKYFSEGASGATGLWKEATRYDVYFDPGRIISTSIIHEALHGATQLLDSDLARKLTGTDYSKAGRGVASAAINDILAQNGCGYKWK